MFAMFAGIDEAGRGPLAGPVVAAAVVLPDGVVLEGIADSKTLSAQERAHVYRALVADRRIQCAVGIVESQRIDEMNILQATLEAMWIAFRGVKAEYALVDGNRMPKGMPGQAVVGGDGSVPAIGAASIVAKYVRDVIMEGYHLMWPEYGFDNHKGYGTKEHLHALSLYGPCPIHRRSFNPVALAVRQ